MVQILASLFGKIILIWQKNTNFKPLFTYAYNRDDNIYVINEINMNCELLNAVQGISLKFNKLNVAKTILSALPQEVITTIY